MRFRTRYRNRYRQRRRRSSSGFVWLIIIVALFLVWNSTHSIAGVFLPLLFVVLAFVALISSFFKLSPSRIYGGFLAFIWLMGLALCFVVGFWPWILIPTVLTVLLSVLRGPLLALLLGLGLFGLLNRNQTASTLYTPPMQPYQSGQQPVQPYIPPYPNQQPPQAPYYQPYGEGYQVNREQALNQGNESNSQPYPSTSQYDQPQSHYPQQELPLQQ